MTSNDQIIQIKSKILQYNTIQYNTIQYININCKLFLQKYVEGIYKFE